MLPLLGNFSFQNFYAISFNRSLPPILSSVNFLNTIMLKSTWKTAVYGGSPDGLSHLFPLPLSFVPLFCVCFYLLKHPIVLAI